MANVTNIQLNQSKISNLRFISDSMHLDISAKKEAIDILVEEGGESFYNYVEWLGLATEPDLIVLSSKHHYYYDPEEMDGVKTVVNLKELNQIKHIKPFLHSCLHFLPENSNFVGCFIDNEKINGYELRNLSHAYSGENNVDDLDNGIVSRIPFVNWIYSLMDAKTNRYMSKKSIALLLKEFNFKVMDMTGYNGFTFFHSQKFQDCN